MDRASTRGRVRVTAALVLLAGGCGGTVTLADAEGPPPVSMTSTSKAAGDGLASVATFAENELGTCGFPGAAIGIIQDGQLVGSAEIGFRDDDGNAVTPATRFLTAGLSRAMVGAAALTLEAQGKLSLSAPVSSLVPLQLAPGFSADALTPEMLLTQTSGLPDLDTSNLTCATGDGAFASWFSTDTDEPLWTPPGQVWDYSQRGYAVMGWVLSSASGEPFEQTMASLVFAPAGMTDATYDPDVVLGGDYAVGHHTSLSGHLTEYTPGEYDCEASRPGDGVYATIGDVAHFVEALYAARGPFPESAVASFETGQVADQLFPGDRYAYGLYSQPGYKGLDVLSVDGDVDGYQASLWMAPGSRFAAIVLMNGYSHASGCSSDDIAEQAVSTYLGLTGVAPSDWLTLPSTWAPLLGKYYDPFELGSIEVTLSGDSLVATSDAYGSVTLTQQSATAFIGTFSNDHVDETVTFAPDTSGNVGWFVTRLGVGKRQ
jgi:CubicO group peptidase (beta-lactamase class C family)